MWAITSPRFKGLLSPRRGAKGREVSSGWITLSTKSATFTSKLGVRLPPEEKQRNLQSWVRMVAEEAGDSAMDEVVARNLHYPAGDAHTSSTVSLGGGSPSRIGRLDTSSAALMSAYSGGCGGGTLASPRNRPNLGFAYGGVNPGPKARGQILESHDVHFSVNSAGHYWLHVSLRTQSAPVKGSPFLLTVAPGAPHPLLTQVSLPLRGYKVDSLPETIAEQRKAQAGAMAEAAERRRQEEKERERAAAQARLERRPGMTQARPRELTRDPTSGDLLKLPEGDASRSERPSTEQIARGERLTTEPAPAAIVKEETAARSIKADRDKAERDKAADKAAADQAAADKVESNDWFSCETELVVRDRMGNAVRTGGSNVTCGFAEQCAQGADVDVDQTWHSVEDLGDGCYLLKWGGAVPGNYGVFVKLDGFHVLGSPALLKLEL